MFCHLFIIFCFYLTRGALTRGAQVKRLGEFVIGGHPLSQQLDWTGLGDLGRVTVLGILLFINRLTMYIG
jgi:hypothetical protein